MKAFYFLIIVLSIATLEQSKAQDSEQNNLSHSLKRHKVGAFLGNSLIHEVHNTQTGKEQYVLAPTFGVDYEYWLNHKWAVGTYNELAFLNIEVEHNEEEFIKRENVLLFSGVVIFEPFHNFAVFAGTGLETDPHHTFWIRYLGVEYAIVRCNDWDISIAAGYVNKDLYDAFTFGVVIGRRFGKNIPTKSHH